MAITPRVDSQESNDPAVPDKRAASASPRRGPRLTREQWGAVLLLLSCQSLVILDTTGFNIALAAIGSEFGLPLDQVGAVNLGYVVALASMIPLAGWLGERFGTVRVLIVSLSVVSLGAIVGATAESLPLVMAARIMQGIGSGGLIPLGMSLVFRNFTPMRRLRVIAAIATPLSIAPALGPLMAGFLVEQLSWRWVFLMIVPLSITGVIVAFALAREPQNRAVRPLDLVGCILTVIGFGATILGMERLATGPHVLTGSISLAVGLTCLGILIPLQRRRGSRAFLDINLFRHRVFAKATAILAMHSVGFMGFGLAGPLLLQTQLGLSAIEAGLIGATGALGPLLSSRIARRLVFRVGPRWTIAISQSGMITGLSTIILGYALTEIWVIGVGVFAAGFCALLTIVTCQTVGSAAVPEQNLGDATTLDGTSRQMSNATGITVVSGALALAAAIGAPMLGTVAMTIGTIILFHVVALVILASPGRLPLPSDDKSGRR